MVDPRLVRPQPLGIFPLPLGYLLVPAESDHVRADLIGGKLPQTWPASLAVHRHAHDGDTDAALAAASGTDPVSRYNRYVLDPTGVDVADLRTALGPDLAPLVDLVRYTLGDSQQPPEVGETTGELAALILSAQAAYQVETNPYGAAPALDLLDQAVAAAGPVSPTLAGLLTGARAELRHRVHGPVPAAIADYHAALDAIRGSDLDIGQAELNLGLGSAYQQLAADRPDQLRNAVRHYHAALALTSARHAPEVYAAAHANLAAAYLTMPMTEASDQLRLGIAVRSLREALAIFRRDTHPVRWASTQLNLANALVYAPSTHRTDNLVEAVELYEAVIETRDRHTDPLGRARALANQGNALAHLGIFDQATAKLHEARFLFEELDELAAVRDVRGILDDIARQTALAGAERSRDAAG